MIDDGMRPEYFRTRFMVRDSDDEWPDEFVILSAYATTGEGWTAAEHESADARLEAALRELGVWRRSIFHVLGNRLSVISCQGRGDLVPVGGFRERVERNQG